MQASRARLQSVRIRTATRADFPSIARLQAASWRHTYHTVLPPSYLRDRVEQDLADYWDRCRVRSEDILLVAERMEAEPHLVGFIAVWCRPEAFIDNLHCDPTETGKGIGKALMEEAFEQLLLHKKQTVTLTVLVENIRARSFYLRMGGNPLKRQKEAIFGHPVLVDLFQWDNIHTVSKGLK